MFEASFYTKHEDRSVDCFLCRHSCHIKDGGLGICKVRENKGGTLWSIFYGRPCSIAVDPVEKKPLFHFHPSSRSLSIATLGCNFQCQFCQNWDISQYGREKSVGIGEEVREAPPEQIAKAAADNACLSISYTYSEPTIFYEYARDVALKAKPLGIRSVFVTNGFMTRAVLEDARNWLSAANVDLKAFKDETYKKVMKGELRGVLDSISQMHRLGIWVEITTLVVPKMNDDPNELKDIAEFIASVSRDIPWHISRFYPQYKMTDREPTPEGTIDLAYDIGKKAGLKYVYTGNMPGDERESTFCWKCSAKLIERSGFFVRSNILTKDGSCPKCGAKIDGIF